MSPEPPVRHSDMNRVHAWAYNGPKVIICAVLYEGCLASLTQPGQNEMGAGSMKRCYVSGDDRSRRAGCEASFSQFLMADHPVAGNGSSLSSDVADDEDALS
jgi:hypothetical protein